MIHLLRKLWWNDEGQDIAEYAVMLAVILVLVVGTVRLVGSHANNVFSNVASSIQWGMLLFILWGCRFGIGLCSNVNFGPTLESIGYWEFRDDLAYWLPGVGSLSSGYAVGQTVVLGIFAAGIFSTVLSLSYRVLNSILGWSVFRTGWCFAVIDDMG
jgi:Flp pilus assembly pilin Flp